MRSRTEVGGRVGSVFGLCVYCVVEPEECLELGSFAGFFFFFFAYCNLCLCVCVREREHVALLSSAGSGILSSAEGIAHYLPLRMKHPT